MPRTLKGVQKYFLQTKNHVGAAWRDLARCLKFETHDIDSIHTQFFDDKARCMELLQQWHTRNGNDATIHVLIEALAEADLQRVVDHLQEKFPELTKKREASHDHEGPEPKRSKTEAPAAATPSGSGGPDNRPGPQTLPEAPPSGSGGPGSRPGPQTLPEAVEDIMSHPGSGGKPVVLLLNDEYGTRKGGISTIHRGMARLLVSRGAKVYSTVLETEKEIEEEDKNDAANDKVELIFPTRVKGDKRKPTLDWLTYDHRDRYPNIPSDVEFIVGHVNITSRAARQIKEQRFPNAKVVQVTHVIPEDVARFKSEEKELSIEEEKAAILDDLEHADVIVAVGPRMYDYYKNETREEERLLEFLPEPSDIFKKTQVKYVETETKVVLSVGRVKGVERLKGYDLVGTSMGKVMKDRPNTKWRVRGIKREDFSKSKGIIQASMKKFEFVPFTPLKYGTQEELSKDMKQAHVVLMPSRAEPFGLVGLEAIAAGVPVLVSDRSGLAKFLGKDSDLDRPIVEIEEDGEKAAETLAKRIINILDNGEKEFQAAKKLKKNLLASKYWEESHCKFLKIFGL